MKPWEVEAKYRVLMSYIAMALYCDAVEADSGAFRRRAIIATKGLQECLDAEQAAGPGLYRSLDHVAQDLALGGLERLLSAAAKAGNLLLSVRNAVASLEGKEDGEDVSRCAPGSGGKQAPANQELAGRPAGGDQQAGQEAPHDQASDPGAPGPAGLKAP